MKFATVTKVHDLGAIGVMKEALADAQIPAEVEREPLDIAKGMVSTVTWLLKVPEEQIEAANQVLSSLENIDQEALAKEALAASPPPAPVRGGGWVATAILTLITCGLIYLLLRVGR